MVGIEIGYDEEVLAESSGVQWTSKLANINQRFETLVLTNKRIYGVYQKNNGIFKKTTEEMMELQLADIKIVNGQLMVKRNWSLDYCSWLLEIQTVRGAHTFLFAEATKKTTALWEAEIYKSLGQLPPEEPVTESAFGGLAGITAGLKGIAGAAFNKAYEKPKKNIEIEEVKIRTQSASGEKSIQQFQETPPIPNVQQAISRFCTNCGTRINEGAKFCHSCGASVDGVKKQATPIQPIRTATGNYSTRVQEYAGTVLKCPNCGNVVSSLDAVCFACGMHLTGKMASGTVQKLSDRLLEIERDGTVENKGGLFNQIGYEERVRNAHADAYRKKLTLIRTFPIPNTVDEIYEFMLLATTNINVKVSKNTVWSKFENSGSSEKEISDAWIAKMRQAYQKAEIAFPKDPAFKHIQKIYFDKMNELKMEV